MFPDRIHPLLLRVDQPTVKVKRERERRRDKKEKKEIREGENDFFSFLSLVLYLSVNYVLEEFFQKIYSNKERNQKKKKKKKRNVALFIHAHRAVTCSRFGVYLLRFVYDYNKKVSLASLQVR